MKSCSRPLLSVSIALVAISLALPLAHAAESGSVQDVKDIKNRTTVVTPAELAAAAPIKTYLRGASKLEPDICVDEDGEPIDSLTAEKDLGTTNRNGLSISPGGYEISDLLPGKDYRLCLVVRNYSNESAQLAIDDVDLRAGETTGAGVTLIDDTAGVGSWVIPVTRSFVAEKGMLYKVPYILRVPDNLPAGTIVGGVRVVRQAIVEPIQAAVTQRIYISSPGGKRGTLKLEDMSSSRFITGKPGSAALHIHYTMRNSSDYLTGIGGTLEVTGLGRKVADQKIPPTTLLPNGAERVNLRQDGLPWIGVFRPTLKFQTSNGTIEKRLPLVWVLPPWPFVAAILLAIFVPILVFVRRWRQRRLEWMMYLDNDDEDEDEDWGGYDEA